MFEKYAKKIKEQAAREYPKEAVWLITKKGCRKVRNVHPDPENHFEVSKADLAKAALAGLLAVVHSHPDRPEVPSANDMQGQVNTDVPWGVLSCTAEGASDIRWWGTPERAPLIGRPFVHGISDCYSLIRDYYFVEKGITLPEFPRSWGWWDEGEDLFIEGFEKAGFARIASGEVKPGDVWLARIRSGVVNHGGVVLDHGLALHQIGSPRGPIDESRLSAREPMARYLPHVELWLRYVGGDK